MSSCVFFCLELPTSSTRHFGQCMQMLMDLGPVVYVEDFEKQFLAKASEFYQVLLHVGIA